MRNTACVALLSAGLISITEVAVTAEPVPRGIEVPASAIATPKTQFVDPKGLPVVLNSFEGKTIILNVWATWCGPCIKELPSLDRLAGKLDRSKAMVLAVSQDRGGTAIAKPFLDRLGVKNLQAYADPTSKLSRDLGIRGLPTTVIIAPNGMIVGRVEGQIEWESDEIVRYAIYLADGQHESRNLLDASRPNR